MSIAFMPCMGKGDDSVSFLNASCLFLREGSFALILRRMDVATRPGVMSAGASRPLEELRIQ